MFGLTSMLLLDIVYMNLLAIANGAKIEDIIEDWEKHPIQNAGFYMSRLPVLGRYMGMVGELAFPLLQKIATGKSQMMRDPGIIPFAALKTVLNNAGNVTAGLIHEESSDKLAVNSLSLLRVIPFLGDTLVRGGLFLGTEFLGNEDFIERPQYRSIGKSLRGDSTASGSSGGLQAKTYYGPRQSEMQNSWEAYLGEVIRPFVDMEEYNRSGRGSLGNIQVPFTQRGLAQQPAAQQAQPVPKQAPPTASPDTVESILDAPKALEAPDSLLNQ